jgi:hypothetical protein
VNEAALAGPCVALPPPAGFPMDSMALAGVDKLAPARLYVTLPATTGTPVDSPTLTDPPEGLAHQRANQPGDI